jgi:hypothetical protein
MPIQIIEEAPGLGARFGAGLAKGLRENKPVEAFFEAMQQKNKKKEELAKEEKIQGELTSFADKLRKNNPNSPIHQSIADIYESDLPFDKKSQVIKDLTGVDPFKSSQQKRLKVDQMMKFYNFRIKELQESMKTARFDEKKILQDDLRSLQKERNSLIGNAVQDDDLYDMFLAEDDSSDEPEMTESPEPERRSKKAKFDPKNKEHVAKFNQLDKKLKGDKKKVNAALSKEFTL